MTMLRVRRHCYDYVTCKALLLYYSLARWMDLYLMILGAVITGRCVGGNGDNDDCGDDGGGGNEIVMGELLME